MSSEREIDAARLVAIRVMRDMLAEVDQDTRARMLAEMLPGAREVAAVGPERTPVGAVTRSKPGKDKTAARVTDAERFQAWVVKMHPHQIVFSVDPTYTRSLLSKIDSDPDYETCDENGEVLSLPPGVDVVTTPGAVSSLRVLPDDCAADVIRAALAAGELAMVDLLALPAGEDVAS
jgi:hypothetical protein